MVDAARIALAAEGDVERRQAEVLEERRIVRPRAERAYRHVATVLGGLGQLLVAVAVAVIGVGAELGPRPRRDRAAGLGIGDVGGDGVGEMLKLVAARSAIKTALVTVGVDVNHRLRLQLGGVGFGVFGRAEEHRFLAVPTDVDDRPVGPPAALYERAERFGLR